MSDYKYQVSIGWDKNRGWSLLANVPADTLDELDDGILDIFERIDGVQKKIKDRENGTVVKNNEVKQDPNTTTTRACETCGGDTEYKEGTSKTGRKWRAYFCNSNKDHVTWLK